ncbi:hypothetical protein [Frankia sp. Mgl5]|uniref:hypothetical protein n=1 Tax=Frankia sp. Mgl5 TaxID=2933793 RepID=UPI00200E6B53|nr:hypothetical protein [Frankia sp. Mgl5]
MPGRRPRLTSRRVMAAAALLGLTVLAAGCESGEEAQAGAIDGLVENSSAPAAWPVSGERSGGTLILLECDQQGGFTLRALSASSGSELGRQSFTLPDRAELRFSCDSQGSPTTLNEVFSSDFTKAAVRVTDLKTMAFRAATLDLISGELETGAPAGEFAAAPHHLDPVFNPANDDLWYIDATDSQDWGERGRLVSRPTGSTESVDHGDAEQGSFVLGPKGSAWWTDVLEGSATAINPSDTYAAQWERGATYLLRPGERTIDAPVLAGEGLAGDTSLPGADESQVCSPQSWIDDHRLICVGSDRDRLYTLTLSADYHAVDSVDYLTPQTGRYNGTAVVSPDRSRIAFVSKQGEQVDLFQTTLDGSAPKKIAALSPSVILLAWK